MRCLKWISVLTILALLCSVLSTTVAEDEIVIEMDESADEEFEIEIEGGDLEGLDAFDDSAFDLDNVDLELDGLEDNLSVPETEEQSDMPAASNASGDFEIDEDGTLVRYGGFEKNVVIPDGVKVIGSGAFNDYTKLESVTIPDSVTDICNSWYGAFSGCTGLKSIIFSNNIKKIGIYAFEGCTGLENIDLPNGLESLGHHAFSNCSSLESITLPNSIKTIETAAFSGCKRLKRVQLPATMTELSDGLFADCDSLDNLNFLSGITNISSSLFEWCDGLRNITIPISVTTVGSNAFKNCINLESIMIHSGVSFIDRTAFDESDNVVIRGSTGTYAESYANGVGIPFNAPIVTINEKTTWIEDEPEDFDAFILYINQSHTLDTVQKPADLARKLSWSSSNPEIATVDQNGQVTGISQGTATITVNTADGKGKAAQIKVVVPEPTSLGFRDDDPDWGESIESLDIRLRNTQEIYV